MKTTKGMVLIIALVFLLLMMLMISVMFLLSQLTHKSAVAGQQQLQLSQQALQQHLEQARVLKYQQVENAKSLAECPAQYAAWSQGPLYCEVLQLDTQSFSANQQFYAGYSSLLLKQNLKTVED